MRHTGLMALLALSCALPAFPQQPVRWSATTGDVVVTATTYAATIQQPATGAGPVTLEQIVIYCSAACTMQQSANGTAATATLGTVTPIQPTPANYLVPVEFYAGSNVGAGVAQGGALHIGAGGTAVICLNVSCGSSASVQLSTGLKGGSNYSVGLASMTGTVNITFFGRATS